MFKKNNYTKSKIGSERNFGLVFSAFFTIIGFYPLLKSEDIRLWALLIALVFLLLCLIVPRVLIIPNKLWFKLGIILGAIVAPVVMGIIFFLTITPIGITMRLFGKDIINKKINKASKSYWIKRKKFIESMENQF